MITRIAVKVALQVNFFSFLQVTFVQLVIIAPLGQVVPSHAHLASTVHMQHWPRPKETALRGITVMTALLCLISLTVQWDITVHQVLASQFLVLQENSLTLQGIQELRIAWLACLAATVREQVIPHLQADALQTITVQVDRARQPQQDICASQDTSARREQHNQ